jgi:hypothetical protein
MADALSRQRVQRLRQSRRERGLKETNVWLEKTVDNAIDQAVESGRYPSRQVAISSALTAFFIHMENTIRK